MFAFSHLLIIFMFIKFQFFKEKRETFRVCLTELLVLSGLGCMYYMLDDESEDESFRLKYGWYVLGCFLTSLIIHFFFFSWNLIITPLLNHFY